MRQAILTACAIMFAEGFNATMSFPFASFMVEHLHGTDARLGFFTGLFFAAFSVGPLLTARMWGSAANYVGRRPCLLTSLFSSILLTISISLCRHYEVVLLLRFAQGCMSCALPMARTSLRERVQQLKGDEVQAFSLLQAAFAISSVMGPALGGILYGWPAGNDFLLPWAVPHILASCLYVSSFTFATAYFVETADLDIPMSLRRQKSDEVDLFRYSSVIYTLIMTAGHSYVFTGWEVGYPLLARNPNLEAWSSEMIGVTFLIGSICLLLHTVFTYPVMVKKLGLNAVWSWSWIVCIVMLITFPRLLKLCIASGFAGNSWCIFVANYVAQIFISVLQGCNFTTLQLMLNRVIAARGNEYALSLANGYMVSAQGLARATSPIMTGSLIARPSLCEGVMAFDALACIAAVCCLLFGWALQRRIERESDNRASLIQNGGCEGGCEGELADADGYKEFIDELANRRPSKISVDGT